MASWFRKKRKAKAPEPIALVGLECGVDDEGDDEERVPSKTFSHRMGPDSPWEPYPAHLCLVIEEAMRAKPSGGSVRLSEHLPFEIRWGTKATSSRLRGIPTTRMIQVNLRSTNTRVVRADPPPLPPKSSWTGGAAVDSDPNWPTRRGNATRLLKNQWGSTRRRRRRHFVLGPIPGEDEQSRWTLRWYNKEGDIQPCGAVSLRHGDVSIHNGGDRVIDVRVAGSPTGCFQMVCDDAAARDGWWRALARVVSETRALARKRTIVSGYVVKDLDDGATLTEQFADAATTTVFGKPPRTPDGRVLERALSERSSKSGKAYRQVVKLIIRPPRAEYDVKKLGPTPFTYVRRFRGGKQTVMRTEFAVVNARQDVELKCSQWKPVGSSLADLPCVLYLHGNASCRLEALQVLKVVLELGCTLCCVDLAGSGLSEGEFVSLGHFEKFDAEAVLHELRSGGRSNGRVALWGRSMGAATALMVTAKLDPLVSCVIADSAFASLPMLVHDLLDEKVGSVLVDAAMGVVSRSVAYRAGFKISDVRVDAVAPVCPILLVHGSEDTFVKISHSRKLQDAFKKTATLRVDEGGKHDSRRPDDVLIDCAAFLLDKLVGEPAAVQELRAALTLTRGLGRPPFASSTNFTSGADANRQKAVRATLTRGGAVAA